MTLIHPTVPSNPFKKPQLLQTTYTSEPTTFPSTFLTSPPSPNAPPATLTRIDFSTSPLPQYHPSLALILDNILTPHECATLLSLAESSAGTHGWRPALVNAGANHEVHAPDYRNSERIIWDDQDLVDRIWKRCCAVEGVMEAVETWGGGRAVSENWSVLGARPLERGEEWRFSRLNERMRFLRYGRGMFFAAHCDGSYVNPHAPLYRPERSLLTLQLYLTNDNDTSDDRETLVGGATTFLPLTGRNDESKRLSVEPRPGRVLIFQHRGLLHEGTEVLAGTKYTMRTDLMYERVASLV